MDKNIEKQERYKILKVKLKKAIASEFWFEALMIEYAINEDRTSSILHYSNVSKNAYSSNKKLGNKLSSIEYQIGKKHPIISKKVCKDNIEQIKIWKDMRNDVVHRSCTMFDELTTKQIALNGITLVNKISNDSKKVMNYAKAHIEKE